MDGDIPSGFRGFILEEAHKEKCNFLGKIIRTENSGLL